jgi:hypothetical protein
MPMLAVRISPLCCHLPPTALALVIYVALSFPGAYHLLLRQQHQASRILSRHLPSRSDCGSAGYTQSQPTESAFSWGRSRSEGAGCGSKVCAGARKGRMKMEVGSAAGENKGRNQMRWVCTDVLEVRRLLALQSQQRQQSTTGQSKPIVEQKQRTAAAATICAKASRQPVEGPI